MKENSLLKSQYKHLFEETIKGFLQLPQEEISLTTLQALYLKQEELICQWHKKRGKGEEIVHQRSQLIDFLIKKIFEIVISKELKKLSNDLCIIAFGGYGREEMSPFSDVDIMFLYEKQTFKRVLPSKEKNKNLSAQSPAATIDNIRPIAPSISSATEILKTDSHFTQPLLRAFPSIATLKESTQFLKNYFEKVLLSPLTKPSEKKILGIEKIITSILMALWDLGLKVGHATRSLEEALHDANEDKVLKTALLEARFLIGGEKIFSKFKEKFQKKCLLGQEEEYIEWRRENLKKNREKFGKTIFLQEPNIKSGMGGLREYQNLQWISLACGETKLKSYWSKKKFLRETEQKRLEKAYHFLLRVRNEMHYQEKRGVDQLTLRLQGSVSTGLGYPQKNILRRIEAFMKDYYEQTRDIHLITSAVLERRAQSKKKTKLLSTFFEIKEKCDGFLIIGKKLFPQRRETFKDPTRMMKAFYLAQKKSLEFSSELNDLIRRQLFLIDRTFQHSKEIRGIFLNILSQKGEVGRILRMMHDLGFLGKYLPEFGALTCLVQHEFFHSYTADEHTLVCVEKIDKLLFTDHPKLQRYKTLFKNLDDVALLYLGVLLHDTGKAANVRSHSKASTLAAEKVAHRFQLSKEKGEILRALVEFHGELATVARTRDLEDFTVVYHVANIVKTVSTLDALMILTLADGMSTNEEHWSDWKEQLLWNLYDQTKRYLEVGEVFFNQNKKTCFETKKEVKKLLGDDFEEEIEAHFEQMPERYLRMMSSTQIAEHLKLFREFFNHLDSDQSDPLNAEIKWVELPEKGHTEVWFCGWDRNQFLERIAAAFLTAEVNILSADIFTRRDYLTLDIFRVTSVRSDPLLNKKEKKIVEQHLKKLLENNLHPFFNKTILPLSEKKQLTRISHSEVMKKTDGTKNASLTQYPSTLAKLQTERYEISGLDLTEGFTSSVTIDNQSHPLYTIVKIETHDRQGLFYDLLGAFHLQGVSIDLARIATEMKAAFDTFYILDQHRRKIVDRQIMADLEKNLWEII